MPDHFATALRSYMERTPIKAIELERQCGLPNATVAKLLQGQRPSPERIGEILAVIPGDEAAELLRAYLLDDIPPAWREQVTIVVAALTPNRVATTTTQSRDRLSAALYALRTAAEGDISLSEWLIDTARLLNLTDPG